MNDYQAFIERRTQWGGESGFSCELPSFLYDFQADLVSWALRKGRAAIFADTGLGKTAMQLAWANAVVKHTNKPVLLATPIAVGPQTVEESIKFGVDAMRSRDGKIPSSPQVVVTNYERLGKFNPSDFAGMVCDESSCLKDAKTVRKETVVEFMRLMPYRLLCTATAAPNDYWELGTSSEALGYLGSRDMLTTFFKMEDGKYEHGLGWGRTKFRFRGHAQKPFWSWVCSWAKCIRSPADIGYDGSRFVLPPLIETEHTVSTAKLRNGMLVPLPAVGLREQREERRISIRERVEYAADLIAKHDGVSVAWCELNDEADAMEELIPDSKQVSGSMDDDEKEEIFTAFTRGQLPTLITKPKIGCWGLNWQHCNHIIEFPTNSFEQHYQLIRRCHRYGQKKSVKLNIVCSEGEEGILKNLRRKEEQAEKMYCSLRDHMNDPQHLTKSDIFQLTENVPSWL